MNIKLLPLAVLAFSGCVTETLEDGTVRKRVDTKAIRDGLEAGEGAYRFYRNQQRPVPGQPVYQQRLMHEGRTIYPAIQTYPQVITTYP